MEKVRNMSEVRNKFCKPSPFLACKLEVNKFIKESQKRAQEKV